PRARAADSGGEPLLDVVGVTAGYRGRDVLTNLSLGIPRGHAMAWLGRNGAGKSTLAKTIIGLVRQHAGSIRVAGTLLDPLPVEQRARHVGLVFQDPSRQLFGRTVLDEAAFGPRALGMRGADARASARASLAIVGLESAADWHPGDLAPQSQRLLAIAAAMAGHPALLILDEPTAGQDAAGRRAIARALDAQRTRGAAAVITHDLAFAETECDGSVIIG
ncbi:MAG: ABC transporter ATP-binding protein, partial [Gemmatimonadaceae bacterium]